MSFEKKITVKLSDAAHRRVDEAPDENFYKIPRFVTHIDAAAIDAVTELYRKHIPINADVLDLMSSWISHYPEDVNYQRVVGLGMNARELARNKQLDEWLVHDLNTQLELPFRTNEFDVCTICVSFDYLIQPITVLKEIGRVLKKNGALVITYSNRVFETKATTAWLSLSEQDRKYLIRTYLLESGAFTDIDFLDCSPVTGDPLYAIIASAT
ncbi:MAG: SAM-dependent methyltransferase [Gammaproteobacteria bacterium]|jgi:SAM-dependent methyltransferase